MSRYVIFLTLLYPVLLATATTAQESNLAIRRVSDIASIQLLQRAGPALDGFTRISGFIQQEPSDGRPATKPTHVFLAYDSRRLYVVFHAKDLEPDRVRARMASRENIGDDDRVTLMLDTHHDNRRAYAFSINPLGVQWDALWTEGQGFDTSFDTVWESAGHLTEDGYVAVMAVPFKSLRFPANAVQTWGIVLSRAVPRDEGEESYWPRVSSRVQGTLTQSGTITGLAGISPGRNIQAIPYTNVRSFRALETSLPDGPAFVSEKADLRIGADLKAVVRDRFVVDLTANPDFSQVESDQPQVTVNQRFEVFFPERRPFFTENANYFRTPIPVLFTRRVADPRAGVRLTGKAGPWSVGALAADDQAPGRLADRDSPLHDKEAYFTVARVNRDIGAFSTLGAIYAGRELDGGHNRVGGLDGRVRLGDRWTASGQFLRSGTAARDAEAMSGSAAFASVFRAGRTFSYFGSYQDITSEFRASSGFIPRTDFRQTSHFASYFLRPERTLISWGAEVFVTRTWDHGGTLLDELNEGSLEWSWIGDTDFEVNYRKAESRLGPADHPALTDLRAYDVGQWDIEYGTSFLDWLEVDGNLRFGSRINLSPIEGREPDEGDWFQLDMDVDFRPATRLRIDNTVLLTTLNERRSGERVFINRILRTRWSWQFNRELSTRAILQYNWTDANPAQSNLEDRRNLNLDFLLTYRVNPWTAVFVGFNVNGRNAEVMNLPAGGTRLERISGLENDAHQVFLKASYLVRY